MTIACLRIKWHRVFFLSADVMLAGQASGHKVTTVESLDGATGELDPIQQAFVDIGALQSGYSAGAMVLAARALIEANPDPSEAEIRDALSGILDRETGYVKVVEAIRRAAAARSIRISTLSSLIGCGSMVSSLRRISAPF